MTEIINQNHNGIIKRLIKENIINEEDGLQITKDAQKNNQSIHNFLLEKKTDYKQELINIIADEFGMASFDISSMNVDFVPLNLMGEEWVVENQVLPLYIRAKRLFVAISDPTMTRQIGEIKFKTGKVCEPVLVDAHDLSTTIKSVMLESQDMDSHLMDGDGPDLDFDISDDDDNEDESNNINNTPQKDDGPIVKFVNKMLLDGIHRGASDIHFEPYETEYRVRYRIDGIMKTVATINNKLQGRISARLKVMSQLDIAEKRIPQDGRMKLNISKTKKMDFRVSTLPTLFGEKVVLRILDAGAATLGIEKLGYEPHQQKLYTDALANPYGMILVTGPTGSGKTVSLYTGLNILNTEQRNISTAEDPVEIRVSGINQVQVSPKKGMTFAAALRSFLRQDPDVIMVGEIRDLETAEIAVKAAQTGHMVLSTLHTNDAPQTISRLLNMGIASYNITSSVTLVIAQRLARKLCPSCKLKTHLPKEALISAGFNDEQSLEDIVLYEANPNGCPECTDGYKGRTGIYQVMPMSEEIKDIILNGGGAVEIHNKTIELGIEDLRTSALNKVKKGLISLTEADRITKM